MIEINTNDLSPLKKIKAGDVVSITGTIYTARDAAHKRICEMLDRNEQLPFNLNGAFLYYTGATPAKLGEPIGSCGPTTSKRMDVFTPRLLSLGVTGIIGKGERSDDVINAFLDNNAFYFIAVGGAGAYYKSAVVSSQLIAFPELLSEAVYKLEIKDFRCVASIANGKSLK